MALACLATPSLTVRGDPPPPPDLGSNMPPAMLEAYTNSLAARGYLTARPQGPVPLFTVVTNASGRVVLATNDTALAMRRPQPAPSAAIDITPDGAVSRGGGHQVWFDGNLNRSDSIVIQLPDNKGKKMLAGHVVGIRLADGHGKQSWLGLVRDCAGELVKDHPNWLIYRDAFSGGISGDVLYIFRPSAFEQFVILRSRFDTPPEIDEATARLEVVSEFYDPPEPRKEVKTVKLRTDPELEKAAGAVLLDDETLDFGWMRMGSGDAVILAKESPPKTAKSLPIAKAWRKPAEGRVFLIESADLLSLKPAIQGLAALGSDRRHELLAESWPPRPPTADKRQPLLAANANYDPLQPGIVMDYSLMACALLNVDFAGYSDKQGKAATGFAGTDYWNAYLNPNAYSATIPDLAWWYSTPGNPQPSGVSLQVDNAPGQWGFTPPPAEPMYDGYIYPWYWMYPYDNTIRLTISGLPNGQYDFYLYGHGAAVDQNSTFDLSVGGAWVASGSTAVSENYASSAWSPGLQYVRFSQVQVNSGQSVAIVVGPGASPYAALNGLQVAAWSDNIRAYAGPDQTLTFPGGNLTGWATAYQPTERFIVGAIQAPAIENRGRVLLLVDETKASAIANELNQLTQDLVGDGWSVTRRNVPRHDDVTWDNNPTKIATVRSQVAADYGSDLKCIFIIGHVAVPYSGAVDPDGHNPRCWPTDAYYDVTISESLWTDTFPFGNLAEGTNNVAGDGKFDNNTIPGTVQLPVGRVDFANLPAFGGPWMESDLLQRYLQKDHAYRTKTLTFDSKAAVASYFPSSLYGLANGTFYMANPLRDASAWFGLVPTNYIQVDCFRSPQSWLWGFKAGSSYYDGVDTSGVNVTTTAYLAYGTVQPHVGFYEMYGSMFGDWNRTDNFLRACLAVADSGLGAAWAKETWRFEGCALGDPIYAGVSKTLNQAYPSDIVYEWMGDPTLRLQVETPPTGLAATVNQGSVTLNWNTVPEAGAQYIVLRSDNGPNGPFTKLTPAPVGQTTYIDSGHQAGSYQVRSAVLRTTGSGSFYNLSQAAAITVN